MILDLKNIHGPNNDNIPLYIKHRNYTLLCYARVMTYISHYFMEGRWFTDHIIYYRYVPRYP